MVKKTLFAIILALMFLSCGENQEKNNNPVQAIEKKEPFQQYVFVQELTYLITNEQPANTERYFAIDSAYAIDNVTLYLVIHETEE